MKLDFINNSLQRFSYYDDVSYQDFSNGDMSSFTSGGSSATNLITTGANLATNPVGTVISFVANLFKNDTENDWRGWDIQDQQAGRTKGSTVRGYIIGDGDDIPREARNIASYINAYGINVLLSGNPAQDFGDKRYAKDGRSWRDVTVQEIATKLQRGGKGDQAAQLLGIYTASPNTSSGQNATSVIANQLQQANAVTDTTQAAANAAAAATKAKEKKLYLIVGIVAAVVVVGVTIFLIVKSKK